jgi:hypothetical protein
MIAMKLNDIKKDTIQVKNGPFDMFGMKVKLFSTFLPINKLAKI